jgi:DNA replication protein DnaC
MEDVDYKAKRGLQKQLFLMLGENTYIKDKRDIILTGLTGVGKSYLASALLHKACQSGYKALFIRVPRLFRELAVAKADGSYNKYISKLSKFDVLVLDDWGIAPLNLDEARDFFEIVEERHKNKSTIYTSQIPLKNWFDIIGDSTIADAVMDRVINNSHVIKLEGDSMRKNKES